MNRKTNKTAEVLKLLTKSESGIIENPIINEEFKEEVIHVREIRHAKKSELNGGTSVLRQNTQKDTGINVVVELVEEWLPITMQRFNFDPTDVCKAEMTVEALNSIPPRYVYIRNEKDFANIKNIKEKYKNEVINTLVHIAIKAKNNPKYIRIS